ncbi:rRNA methyltransferase 3, mitochondrial [Phlebotomus argentipes]|uniref:rRNA methyltransferase 3, mitochondrial n=1 Tax=Phlebotomus argentipes TaxID=94469 RepID=UPI002893013A|nr:rRNA methyltransferase 3, mitochondrial [Phlebotomus argentipes]
MQMFRKFASCRIFSRNLTPVVRTTLRLSSSAANDFPKPAVDVEKLEEDLFGREVGQAWTERKNKRYPNRPKRSRSSNSTDNNTKKVELKIDKDTDLAYADLHHKDPIIRDAMMLLRSGKKLKKGGLLLLEGRRLIEDALKCNVRMRKLFFSRPEDLQDLAEQIKMSPTKTELYRITYKDLTLWSQLTTSPGLMAIFDRPVVAHSETENILPISVICDNIREPSNLGSVIRMCAALPCREVLVMKGCTDPFEPKCLRGGAGAQFHVPVKYPVAWEELEEILPKENSVFVAESNPKKAQMLTNEFPVDVAEYCLPSQGDEHHMTVIIGGETHGISEEGYGLMKLYANSACLHIPVSGGVESLNTASALAVILFELRRKINQRKIVENVENSEDIQ